MLAILGLADINLQLPTRGAATEIDLNLFRNSRFGVIRGVDVDDHFGIGATLAAGSTQIGDNFRRRRRRGAGGNRWLVFERAGERREGLPRARQVSRLECGADGVECLGAITGLEDGAVAIGAVFTESDQRVIRLLRSGGVSGL